MIRRRHFGLDRILRVVVVFSLVLPAAGCSTGRVWGKGAAAGAVAGTATGLAIPLAVRPEDGPEQTGIILGSAAGGAVLGALVGHYLFDKKKEPPKVAVAPPPPPPPAPPKPMVVLEGTHFAFDSSTLTPAATAALAPTVESLEKDPSLRVRIEGHTDNVGTAAYNQALSQRRAEAVKRYLTSRGIASSRMDTVGLGFTQPVADNATAEGRAKNRRVEVHKAP
jgi:OOP family OmpA-OmpF porin